METNWAEENLKTIRTLMERSAMYRRALAPIMIFVGIMGMLGGVVGTWQKIGGERTFVLFWVAVALIALIGSLFLVRRQALKDSEPFWSPPTKRVTQALIPPFLIGAVAGFLAVQSNHWFPLVSFWDLPALWIMLYGCALNAAGFFMVRGIRVFGWLFLLCGFGLIALRSSSGPLPVMMENNLVMGEVFGGLHLAYGIYLYFTEKRGNES